MSSSSSVRNDVIVLVLCLIVLIGLGVGVYTVLFAGAGEVATMPDEGDTPVVRRDADQSPPRMAERADPETSEESAKPESTQRDPAADEPERRDLRREPSNLPTNTTGLVMPNAVVWGQVELRGGIPAQQVPVYLLVKRAGAWVQSAQVTTNDAGMFGFGDIELLRGLPAFRDEGLYFDGRGLQPGDYRLEARKRGYELGVHEVSAQGITRQNIALEEMQAKTITFHVTNTGGEPVGFFAITGVARDRGVAGKPTTRFTDDEEARFQTRGSRNAAMRSGLREGESLISNAANLLKPIPNNPGWYSAKFPPFSNLTFMVVQQGYRPITPPDGMVHADLSEVDELTINVEFEKLEDPLQTHYQSGESTIKGVVKASGIAQPTGRSTVWAILENGEARRTNTDPNTGAYELNSLVDGAYLLRVFVGGIRHGALEREVELKGEAIVDFTFSAAQLKVQIDSPQVSLSGASLTISSKQNPEALRQFFNPQQDFGGTFTLGSDWAPGEYAISIDITGAVIEGADSDGKLRFTIPERGGEVALKIKVISGVKLAAQIVDADGYGWAGAEARLVSIEKLDALRVQQRSGAELDWKNTRSLYADHLGRMDALGIPPGRYALLVWTTSQDPNRWDHAENILLQESSDLGVIRVKQRAAAGE